MEKQHDHSTVNELSARVADLTAQREMLKQDAATAKASGNAEYAVRSSALVRGLDIALRDTQQRLDIVIDRRDMIREGVCEERVRQYIFRAYGVRL